MKNLILTFISSLLLLSFTTNAQKLSVSGKIISAENGEALNLASVCIKLNQLCATTNEKGKYKIEHLQPGKYNLTVSFVGYNDETKEITLNDKNLTVDIKLTKA